MATKPNTNNDSTSDASKVREVSQDQRDRVAIVSRTATGEASQNPGYEVLVPEDADEATRAAAENRPEKG